MNADNVMKKNRRFYMAMVMNILEGLLAGCNFMTLYLSIRALMENDLNTGLLFTLTGILAAIFAVRLVIYCLGYTQGQIGGADVSKRIRLFLGDKIKKIPLSRFTKSKTGEYINVASSDVNNYENILTHKLGDIIKNVSLSALMILFAFAVYPPAGLIALTADLMLAPTLWASFRSVKKFGNEKNRILADNVSNIVEYITGIQTFRAYGAGGTKNKTVTGSMGAYSDISYRYERRILPIGVVFSLFGWGSLPVTAFAAGSAWLTGALDTATYLVVLILPLFVAKLAFTMFIDMTAYKNLTISKRKIQQVTGEEEEPESDILFAPQNHDLRFENVVFSYEEGEPVLTGVSFTAENEKLTAIVGDSGSGKSTILNLIAKYYEPQAGDIKIGGVSIKNIAAEKVLRQISMVDQDVFLFNDTIRDNIRYARLSAGNDEIEEACRLANCDSFIRGMEKGYETPTGENGNQLSGGERQRISVARAILKNSPILLLDEATASLDIENELAVKEAVLNLLRSKKTVIMIAHTLSIIQNADKILVVADGKIIEQGRHEELLNKHGKYYAMWRAEEQISATSLKRR
ncbi:MAG: ABC transporter ATP-binding protein [Clostridiaceae bacterium]|nr:ABC transporter ATP-binding protein [Clostridiaceae bacterium]